MRDIWARYDKVKVKVLVTQLCLTLCDPTDCSPAGSSVHRSSPGENIRVGCHSLQITQKFSSYVSGVVSPRAILKYDSVFLVGTITGGGTDGRTEWELRMLTVLQHKE